MKPNTKCCTFRLRPDEVALLEGFAADLECSQTEVVSRALAQFGKAKTLPESQELRKLSKANQRVAEVAAADITARAVDRDDVAYDTDELPTQHITSVPPAQPAAKIDVDNLPDVKPIGMPRAQWEMLQRKKNPPPPPSWREKTVPITKPNHKS